MRLSLFTLTFLAVLFVASTTYALVPVDGGGGGGAPPVTDYVRDYQTVRKVGLALAVIGFCLGVSRLATSEAPSERNRAQSLVALTAAVFVLLAGDRMIARGLTEWFGFDPSALPVFWQ